MAPLSWTRLALIAGALGLIAWVLTRTMLTSGHSPLAVPWTVLAVSLAGAGLALAFAWSVRQYRRGKNPGLSALRAARTAVYAQASAYAGAIIAGAYAGYGFAIALEWSHEPRREVALSALVAAAGGLALTVAGLVAEHWCRADDGDDENKREQSGTAA